jgi:hypothetical protein
VKYRDPDTNPRKQLVFVNGVFNSAPDFQASCQHLCRLTGSAVIGVYNEFGLGLSADDHWLEDQLRRTLLDGAFDIGQAVSDWVGVGLRAVAGTVGLDSIVNSIGLMNGYSSKLFSLLLHNGFHWPTKPLCIVAHSQGNLITSNALMVYSSLARKYNFARARIHVFSVASPAVSWPTNDDISVGNYWHRYDLVTAVSMWRNWRGSVFGEGAKTKDSFAHSFEAYLKDKRLVDDLCAKLGTKRPTAP